jgi:hypothetical protein
MAICVYFPVEGMSADKYDQVIKELEEAGAGSPPGRSYHVAFQMGDGLQVVDVWDSQEALDAFGQTLMPILAKHGVDPGEPSVGEVRNVIVG